MHQTRLTREPLTDLLARRRIDNPKNHDLGGIDRSIDRSGFVTPVVLNEADGQLLEGHGRLETLARLQRRGAAPPAGIERAESGDWLVPVVRGIHLSPLDAQAFLVAANRLVESGGWDAEKLTAILENLQATPAGLDGSGFSTEDLAALVAELGKPLPAPALDLDDAPAPPSPRNTWVQSGNVFRLGDHLIACGDCRDTSLLDRLAGDTTVDALWSDPPYGVGYTGKTKQKLRIANDGTEGLDTLLHSAFSAVDTVLKPGAPFYIAHPAGHNARIFLDAIAATGWEFRQGLVWLKDAIVLGHGDHHYRHEPIAFGYKPAPQRLGRGARGWFGGNDASSVFEIPRPRASSLHPTIKPVALVTAMLRNSTRRGDRVIDPFLGSGTTVLACEQLGRRCIGIELEPRYVQVAIERWQRLTGREARLLEEGTPCAR